MNDDDRTAVREDPEAIRHEIEATRARIAETAEALAYKTDVSARLKDAIDDRLDATKNAAIDASASALSAAGVAATSAIDATQSAAEKASAAVQSAAQSAAERYNGAGFRGLLERALALPRTSPIGFALALLAFGFVFGLVAPGGGRKKRSRSDDPAGDGRAADAGDGLPDVLDLNAAGYPATSLS